jgi:predicted nucleotidyltransferase
MNKIAINIEEIARSFSWPQDKRSRRLFGFILKKSLEMMDVRRLILYGSRARGDARALSDFDIAIDAEDPDNKWVWLWSEVDDNMETLLDVDFVWLNEVGECLKEQINKDGKILYERSKT